jgi:methyl-accepting chemotaxis protein
MWWRSSRLDRIEENMERIQESIRELAEISTATNRRIDRFVEETSDRIEQLQNSTEQLQNSTEQLQRAMEYLLSRDG